MPARAAAAALLVLGQAGGVVAAGSLPPGPRFRLTQAYAAAGAAMIGSGRSAP